MTGKGESFSNAKETRGNKWNTEGTQKQLHVLNGFLPGKSLQKSSKKDSVLLPSPHVAPGEIYLVVILLQTFSPETTNNHLKGHLKVLQPFHSSFQSIFPKNGSEKGFSRLMSC